MENFKPVTVYQLKRMKAYEKRVMLTSLGTLPKNLPKNIGEITNKIVEINESRPEEVRQWFDAIVLGKIGGNAQTIPTDVRQTIDTAKRELASLFKDATVDQTVEQATAKIDERVSRMEKELTKSAKEALMKAAANYRPIEVRQGKRKKKLKGVFPAEFERIVQLASQRVPIMLVGPAGCGKTYLGGKVAEALSLEGYDQSCSEGISESTFTGWLLPTGASGKFEYVPSPFITAYEKGGVFLFDEMDSADANLLTFLNKAIANDHFFLPQRFKNPKVVKHPDFVPIAAANTYGTGADAQYVGRNALDAATLDRFRAGMITMDYSAPVEEAIIDPDVLEWGRNIRAKIRNHNLFRVMSTRVMLDLTKMKEAYDWGREDWDKAYFEDWSEDERRLVA